MRYVVRLGLRGMLLRIGNLLLHVLGGLHYQWLLWRRPPRAR
jgi:hypothetical protein